MNLKNKAVAGVRWTGSSTAAVILLQVIQISILSRLLRPDEFGLMGMIAVVLGFARSFSDMGISNAIIQRKNTTPQELSSLYWLSIVVNIALFLVLFFGEPLVTGFYREPRLTFPYRLAVFTVLLLAPGQQFQALLQKNMEFRSLSVINITSSFLGAVVSITTAFYGSGVLSMVYGQLVLQGVSTIMLIYSCGKSRLPQFYFSFNHIKGYLGFGFYQMGEKMLNYFASNVDYLIIGRVLGSEPLGYYTLAYKIISMSIQRLNPVITKVAFPLFSKTQDDNAFLRKGYGKILQLLALVVMPFLLGAMAAGRTFVAAVFGFQWLPSVILIQVLAPAGCLKTLINPSGSVLLAKGRADIGFVWNLAVTIMRVVVIWQTSFLGLNAIAWGILIMQIFETIIMQMIINKIIGTTFYECASALFAPTAAVSVMTFSMLILKSALDRGIPLSLPLTAQLIILCLLGGITYLGYLFLFHRNIVNYYGNLAVGRNTL